MALRARKKRGAGLRSPLQVLPQGPRRCQARRVRKLPIAKINPMINPGKRPSWRACSTGKRMSEMPVKNFQSTQ